MRCAPQVVGPGARRGGAPGCAAFLATLTGNGILAIALLIVVAALAVFLFVLLVVEVALLFAFCFFFVQASHFTVQLLDDAAGDVVRGVAGGVALEGSLQLLDGVLKAGSRVLRARRGRVGGGEERLERAG